MTVRLRHIAVINPPTPEFDRLAGDVEIPFVPLEAVWPGDRLDVSRRRRKDDVATGYTRFRNRDILVPKITPTFQADRTVIAQRLEGGVAAGTTELHIVRVGPGTDARYVRYLLSSKPFLDEGEASMIGVAGQKRVPDECLRDLVVPVVNVGRQRAIADYLDAETTRIDALIEKKRRMVELLAERRGSILASRIAALGLALPADLDADWTHADVPGGWQVMRLSQVLDQLTNGFVGPTRDILQDEGVRYIQSLHIKDGKIDFDRRPFYVSEEWHKARPRIHLLEGDVLIVQTGDIGQVAVVPAGFGEASCHALQIARVRRGVVSGPYLAEYLRTQFGYQALLARATGALHPHLEGGIRDVPVVVPPTATQEGLLHQVHEETSRLRLIASRLLRQLDLLRERRQALITAAVTGELPIPGIAA
ncbi:MAG: restriction endonuclease subunit S [Candidatus Dormibacteria bacterium]